MSSGTGSSQSNVLDVSFRKISFPWIITGAKNPRGSYILLTVDSIPRRVTGLLYSDNWKRNLSVLRSHFNPRLRWSGLVLASRSKSFRFVARSLDGKADTTSKLFKDANL